MPLFSLRAPPALDGRSAVSDDLTRGVEQIEQAVSRDAKILADDVRHGRFQQLMAVLAAFSAIVSGYEAYAQHQRGAYDDWLMWTPVILTPPMTLAALGALVSDTIAHRVLPWTSIAMLIDGVVGFIFHVRGVARLPGGFSLGAYNVTMGPPIFAPLFMLSVGLLGLLAATLRRARVRSLV